MSSSTFQTILIQYLADKDLYHEKIYNSQAVGITKHCADSKKSSKKLRELLIEKLRKKSSLLEKVCDLLV